jgi:RNA methyltransferase, TrmH family
MLTKAQIQFVKSLRQKKYREQAQCFVAEGSKLVLEFINSRFTIDQVYALPEWADAHLDDLHKTPVTTVSAKEMSRISGLTNAAPALVVCKIPVVDSSKQPEPTPSFPVILLDEIRDPGNLGTIIRIADWFGIPRVVCSPETVDLYNPKVIQATMGSVTRVQVQYESLKTFLKEQSSEIPVYALAMEGENINKVPMEENSLLLVGSEAHGLSDEILPYVTCKLSVPWYPPNRTSHAESLNAAVATGIACAMLRQNG